MEGAPRIENTETLTRSKREEMARLNAEDQAIIDNIKLFNENGTRQDSRDRTNIEQAQQRIAARKTVESVIGFDPADHQKAYENIQWKILALEGEKAEIPLADNKAQDTIRKKISELQKTAEYMKQFLTLN